MDKDSLKNYAAPLIGVALVIIWYVFVRPALDKPAAHDDAAADRDSPAVDAKPAE